MSSPRLVFTYRPDKITCGWYYTRPPDIPISQLPLPQLQYQMSAFASGGNTTVRCVLKQMGWRLFNYAQNLKRTPTPTTPELPTLSSRT